MATSTTSSSAAADPIQNTHSGLMLNSIPAVVAHSAHPVQPKVRAFAVFKPAVAAYPFDIGLHRAGACGEYKADIGAAAQRLSQILVFSSGAKT